MYTFISFRRWIRTVSEIDLLAFQTALALCQFEYISIKNFAHPKSALRSYEHDTYTYVIYTATLHLASVCVRCSASGICPPTSRTAPVPVDFNTCTHQTDVMLLFAGALPGRHFVPTLCNTEQHILLGESSWQQQRRALRVGTMWPPFCEFMCQTWNQNKRHVIVSNSNWYRQSANRNLYWQSTNSNLYWQSAKSNLYWQNTDSNL
jgi:hypothetical protein